MTIYYVEVTEGRKTVISLDERRGLRLDLDDSDQVAKSLNGVIQRVVKREGGSSDPMKWEIKVYDRHGVIMLTWVPEEV